VAGNVPPSGSNSQTCSRNRFFGYGDELAELLGGKVQFYSRLDPRLEPTVRREAVTIYEES
jgi:hypothetical protein